MKAPFGLNAFDFLFCGTTWFISTLQTNQFHAAAADLDVVHHPLEAWKRRNALPAMRVSACALMDLSAFTGPSRLVEVLPDPAGPNARAVRDLIWKRYRQELPLDEGDVSDCGAGKTSTESANANANGSGSGTDDVVTIVECAPAVGTALVDAP